MLEDQEPGEVTPAPIKKKKVVTPPSLHDLLFADNSFPPTAAAHEKYLKQKEVKLAAQANVLPKLTQEQWDQMNGKARWDSIVALRGPDFVNSGILKWFTSSIIRFKLSGVMRVGGLVNGDIPFVTLPSGLYTPRTGNFDAGHFLNHIAEAAQWLGVPISWIDAQAFAKLLLNPSASEHYYKVELALYPLTSEPFKSILGTLVCARGYTLPEAEAPAPCQE